MNYNKKSGATLQEIALMKKKLAKSGQDKFAEVEQGTDTYQYLVLDKPTDVDKTVRFQSQPYFRNGIDVANKKIVNVAEPTADTDAATKKYVDEHAGGAEKSFELIEEITLSAETNVIDKTAEPNGTAYNFKEMYIYVENTATASSTTNIPFTVRCGNAIAVNQNSITSLGAANNKCKIYLGIKNGVFDSWYTYDSDRYNYGTPRRFNEMVIPTGNITRITIGAPTSHILAGTKISIYGLRP